MLHGNFKPVLDGVKPVRVDYGGFLGKVRVEVGRIRKVVGE